MLKKAITIEKKDENKVSVGKKMDSENFQVIVFQPNDEFYKLDFKKRLNLLENKIKLAKAYFKKNPTLKGIFVAPEYLFKDLGAEGEKRYYTQEQKNTYKKKLQKLSKDTKMIIAPGTICWSKKSKEDKNKTNHRNTLYFFHEGKVQKLKKKVPHIKHDIDFTGKETVSEADEKLFKTGNDSSIKEIGDLTIGAEICYDSVQGKLKSAAKNQPINIQLIVADGATDPQYVAQHDVLLIHVERKQKNAPMIGKLQAVAFGENYVIELTNRAEDLGPFKDNEDLHTFKFKK